VDYAAAHRFGTKLTREILEGKPNPSRNMWNGKPYRTKAQKASARADARNHTTAPVSWHPVHRNNAAA
jgi:hypothetical protein